MDVYIDTAASWLVEGRRRINAACAGMDAAQLILTSVGVSLLLAALHHLLLEEHMFTPWQRLKMFVFSWFRALPPVKRQVAKEVDKAARQVEDGFNKHMGTDPLRYRTHLPEHGLAADTVITESHRYRKLNKADWEKGMVSGTVYGGDDDLTDLMCRVFKDFAWTNPLHPDVFVDVRRMEAEVVRICCGLFHGDDESCGTMTSGGTESIILACRTYRDIALERGVKFPEMIVPVTAHAAFDKAAQYLRMRITHIGIDEKTRRVDVSAMRRAINRRTCMIVGSTPSFPHGIVDDIEAISKLGQKYDVPVHVDSCLGGFLLPFMDKAGFPMPAVDFRLPGVTSISCDAHKYGFAPKGASVILYRNKSFRLRQIYVAPNWPGGIYACPTIPGSRPGVIIAQCWAALLYYGESGYVETTREIISTARKIRDGLRTLPNVKVFGDPQMSVVGVGSDDFDVYRLSDALTSRGWNLNALQYPGSFHIAVTRLHTKPGVIDRLLKDVKEATAEIMKNPQSHTGGIGQVYGSSQSIPDRSLVHDVAAHFIAALYTTRDPEILSAPASKTNGVTH